MAEEYSEEKAKGTYGIIDEVKLDVEYHVCDLSSLKSVMQFIEWYKSTGRQVNILICNACTYTLSEGMEIIPAETLLYELCHEKTCFRGFATR